MVCEVAVDGLKNISKRTVTKAAHAQKGKLYERYSVNEDIMDVSALGNFDSVQVDVSRMSGTRNDEAGQPYPCHRITYIVEEKPIFDRIIYEGRKKLGKSAITSAMTLKVKDPFNEGKLESDLERIKAKYAEKGYISAQVSYEVIPDEKTNTVTVKLIMDEGPRVRVAALNLNGLPQDTQLPLEKIRNGNINGADLDFFKRTPEIEARAAEIRREIGAGAGTFVFMFAGRIVRDKGVNELVRAFSALRRERGADAVRLLLLGNFEDALDPVAAETRAEISRENSGIFAPGFREDLRPYYAAADAFVLPSYREGFPNAVIQAGAMGVPALVTDINGSNEIVIPGENGVVVPARDEAALLAAMRRFVDGRADAVPAMASRSRALIASRYAREDVWAALLNMYFSLR